MSYSICEIAYSLPISQIILPNYNLLHSFARVPTKSPDEHACGSAKANDKDGSWKWIKMW